jgi:hypothetical protein
MQKEKTKMETLHFTKHKKLKCSGRKKKRIETMFNAPNKISAPRYFYPGDGVKWSLLNFITPHETTWCPNPKDYNLLINLEDN